ncbi:ABC transporter ATP-binding protein [Spiroplasma eriocheiris]|uniref:ABC transporter ATP-binding protein n=1 Tax=Spiroplasma eriocheiris TaxID=315358 RepID=A0A0H3XKF2_9MOLU|nr:ABC transporter ATP-binding protein [Spiroplasma eriocheiris]AHF57946.1 putative ABC-type transport system ATP-binding protein [Spiroplasma eriocheiris CCTCC M 207170]AKM54386.1 ABC transporter ATP-binding protein [Spiroplasma eriocheiris]
MKKRDVTNKIVADPDLAIEIRHFTKKFKDFKAVDNIEMTVSKGKIHGFIGPNGSGKTTTIKSIIGAIIPTEGKLFIHGMKSASTPAKRIIGYIPENARFPKHLNVYQYLVEMSFLRGLKYRQAKTRAEKILENLNLWKLRKKNPNNFSSGMKKKVLLAQALITNPDVLILDEPAANLDPTARQELFNDLLRVREEGKTILICSHILTELQGIADEITILNYGKVVYAGEVINATHNYYQFTVMEPVMLSDLTAIVERYNYKIINKTPDSLIIHLPKQNDDIKTIAYNAMEKRIVLTQIQPYITNISEIYDRVVFSVNRDFGKASALLQPGE